MIVVDIETSGLDVERHGLLSIGAVDMRAPSRRFYGECRLQPEDEYDPESFNIHGVSEAGARSKERQSRQALLRDFASWYASRPVKVVGGLHIQAFDVPFLNAKAKESRVAISLKKRTIDLHTLAYAKMMELGKVVPLTDGWSVMDTEFIYPFCGLPQPDQPRHALKDALWEAECMHRLIYGTNLIKQFAEVDIPEYLTK